MTINKRVSETVEKNLFPINKDEEEKPAFRLMKNFLNPVVNWGGKPT